MRKEIEKEAKRKEKAGDVGKEASAAGETLDEECRVVEAKTPCAAVVEEKAHVLQGH
ncbi:hypothetical protein FACS189472_15630 [Alphaproteobacteria bacterium]|nr:hypothetical protein FACS189472_15630 [Alphaproteobacteria bacterium]